jgi:hypothetical protein
MPPPIHDFVDYRAQQHSFEGMAGFYSGTVNVSGTEKAERFDGAWVSANFFRLLRVRPMLGRDFRDGEDAPGAERVAIIGYQMWKGRFGGDPGVLGKPAFGPGLDGVEAEAPGFGEHVLATRLVAGSRQVRHAPGNRRRSHTGVHVARTLRAGQQSMPKPLS